MRAGENRMPRLQRQELSGLTPFQRAYFWGFAGALVACFSPSKELAYLAPGIIIVAAYVGIPTARNVMGWRLLLAMLGWASFVGLHIAINPGFVLQSAVLTLVTYGTVLVALVFPSRLLASPGLLRLAVGSAAVAVIVQAAVGTAQAAGGFMIHKSFDDGVGDVVEGTIHMALSPSGSFANPMFAVGMTFLLLGLLIRIRQQRYLLLPFAWGGAVLVLASVVHVLLLVAAACVVGFVWVLKSQYLRLLVTPLVMLTVLSAFAVTTLPGNFQDVGRYGSLLMEGQLPKTAIAVTATTEMPAAYPHMPLIGLGPGQFSSRAALLTTGRYAQGGTVPLVPPATSEPTERYLMGPLQASRRGHHFGSTGQPLSSYLSVYSEFGILALLAAGLFLLHMLLVARRGASRGAYNVEAWVFATGCVFLFLLGFQENYWETTQAILPGTMFLKILHDLLLRESRIPELAMP